MCFIANFLPFLWQLHYGSNPALGSGKYKVFCKSRALHAMAPQNAEHDRNEKQRGQRGQLQPADYRTSQWRALFATLTDAASHLSTAEDPLLPPHPQ